LIDTLRRKGSVDRLPGKMPGKRCQKVRPQILTSELVSFQLQQDPSQTPTVVPQLAHAPVPTVHLFSLALQTPDRPFLVSCDSHVPGVGLAPLLI
jgi:hypothetical protein